MKNAALASGVSEEDFTVRIHFINRTSTERFLFQIQCLFQAFLVYGCAFFANSGNYKGFGDSKVIPNLDFDEFESIIKSSNAYKSPKVATLWSKCKNSIYQLTERTQCLGLGNKGVTTYFSENCTQEDSDRVKDWMKMKKMDAFLCRTFKTEENGHKTYEIKLASVEKGEKDGITIPPEEYKGDTFVVTRGDFSSLLAKININLEEAKKYAANKNQDLMIQNYIESFADGNLDAHKDASR